MHRLEHIHRRLERWATWCESGGGRLAVAPWARLRVGNPTAVNPDPPLTHDEQRETDQYVARLQVELEAAWRAVMLTYRRVAMPHERALQGLLVDLAARGRLPLHDDKRPPTKEDIARSLAIHRDTLHAHLCKADRAIDRMIRERRRGSSERPKAQKAVRSQFASVIPDDA